MIALSQTEVWKHRNPFERELNLIEDNIALKQLRLRELAARLAHARSRCVIEFLRDESVKTEAALTRYEQQLDAALAPVVPGVRAVDLNS